METMFDSLTPAQESMFLTLYLRALDSKLPDPILGDTASGELADQLDYDFSKLGIQHHLVLDLALRTKRLDELIRAFATRHPNAVVLDLGAGLDTRALRCNLPVGVDWYDIDYPVVAELRERFLPGCSHAVGADLATPGWVSAIPGDRPAMIVADGLMAYISGEDFKAMTRQVTAHFPSGEFASNAYIPLVMKVAGLSSTWKSLGSSPVGAGIWDPHEAENWGAGLTLINEYLLTRAPEIAQYPQPLRGFTRLCSHSTRVARVGNRIIHYRF